jgi:hypothetical protein
MLPPLDVLLNALGYGLLLPAAVTAIVLIVAIRWGLVPRGGDLIGVAAGLTTGFAALAATGQITWGMLKPDDCWDWLPGLALLASAVGILDRMLIRPVPGMDGRIGLVRLLVRWLLRLIVAGLTTWLVVGTQAKLESIPTWMFGAIALIVTVLWGLDWLAHRWPGPLLPALLAFTAFSAAGVMEFCGFLRLAQMGGVLGAVLVGCTLVAWRRPAELVPAGAIPALAVLLPGLLFATYFNTSSEVPLLSHLLVVVSPICLLATSVLPARWVLVRVGATVLPLAVALTLAARAG